MSGPIVVTGAARGIGAAIASRLAEEGKELVLADLDEEVGTVADRLETSARPVVCDLTKAHGRTELLNALPSEVAGVVNNAGITRDAFITKMTQDQFNAVIDVNIRAAYELVQAVLPRLGEGSSVVSMSSRSYLGNLGQFNYSMSKGAIVGMTRALAQELAPRVRFNAVAPGLIATEMTMAMPQKVRDRLIGKIPLQRMGTPEEVASLVAFLLSDDSSYITGQVHIACGGRSITQ